MAGQCLTDELTVMVIEQDRKEAMLYAMANEYTRKIISSTISKAKSVEEIASENGIPMSTCYRRIRELLSLRILRVERTIITAEGKKHETFRSVVRDAKVNFTPTELSVEVTLQSREPDERLTAMWNLMRQEGAAQIVLS